MNEGKPPTLAKARRHNQCPTSPEDPMNVTQKPRASLRGPINAFCRSCIFDPHAPGGWKQQVHLCSCYTCPLWPVRPRSESEIPQRLLNYFQVSPDDPSLLDPRERPPLNNGTQVGPTLQGHPHCPENPALRTRFSGKAGTSRVRCR